MPTIHAPPTREEVVRNHTLNSTDVQIVAKYTTGNRIDLDYGLIGEDQDALRPWISLPMTILAALLLPILLLVGSATHAASLTNRQHVVFAEGADVTGDLTVTEHFTADTLEGDGTLITGTTPENPLNKPLVNIQPNRSERGIWAGVNELDGMPEVIWAGPTTGAEACDQSYAFGAWCNFESADPNKP
ncbi:MAG: hypothetical protein ACR2OI_00950, partial [Acidimicrobiia bacterium]